MTKLLVLLLATAVAWPQVPAVRGAKPDGVARVDGDARAEQLIAELDLRVLPKESGYIGIIGVTPETIAIHGRSLALQSQNYSLLTRERPIHYLHRLEPADTQVLIEGGPVDYYIFYPDGRAEKQALGMDLKAGQRPVVAVAPGCWKALVLRPGASYALMANALSPEFTTDRVKIGEGAGWVRRFSGKAEWASPEFLRRLIGPNWVP